jgi:Protein of unknown function (DUF3099)
MMGIRILCFILMVAITPYGWYTWVLGAGAIVLPYIAVILANVGEDVHTVDAENPERALPAAPTASPVVRTEAPPVIRIEETRALPPQADPPAGDPR